MHILSSIIAFLPVLAAATPLSEVPSSTRLVVRRLTPDQRTALAQQIAVELFSKGVSRDYTNKDQLDTDVANLLSSLGSGDSDLERRLFGFGDSDDSSPSDGYAPYRVDCPADTTFVRVSKGLSSVEQEHVDARLGPSRFLQFLSANNISASTLNLSLNSSSSTNSTPHVAVAFSGGGYRAMISGGGGVWGMDSRNSEATTAGTGEILQTSSYWTGLSGGSWLTGSYYANQGRTIPDLAQNIWNLSSNLIIPDKGFLDTTSYFTDLISEVKGKRDLGFATAITDYWALALSGHLFPSPFGPTETPNLTIADLANLPKADYPFPLIVAAEREPGDLDIPTNATVWEFGYNEFGTWGFGGGVGGDDARTPGLFTPVKYLGTELNNGQPNSSETQKCFQGFDNLGFVVGTSSTLFNAAFLTINGTGQSGILVSAIQAILSEIGEQQNDVSVIPNPFIGFAPDVSPIANFSTLTLIDAGLTNQNIPLEPLLVPARKVDVIFAFDASADTTYSWPNGSAMITSYKRFQALSDEKNLRQFMPAVPGTNTFVNEGLNQHPTFFGCDGSDRANTTAPLIIYVPNYPWSTASNTSTFQLQYETDQALAIIQNGARSLTLNGTLGTAWPTCLACAMADRAVARAGNSRSEQCKKCFSQWCWNGTYNETQPSGDYVPIVGTTPQFLVNLGVPPNKPAAGAASETQSASSAVHAQAMPMGAQGGFAVGAAMAVVLASAVGHLIA